MDQQQSITETGLIIDLRYRKVVFKIFYLIVFACIVSLAFIVRLNILKLAEQEWYLVTFKLILAASVPLTVLIRATIFLGPRLFSQYKADSSKLMITRRGKTREAYFEQIDQLFFSKLSPRFLGGYRFRLKSGVCFRFPTLMEKSDQLLHLIMKARPDLKTYDEFEQFLNTLRLVEVSWQRIRDKFANWKHNGFKYLIYPGALAFFFHYRGLLASIEQNAIYNYLIWFCFISVCHFSIVMFFNHFEEKLNNSHLIRVQTEARSEDREPAHRDKHYERRLEMTANTLFYLLTGGIALAILFKN